MNIIKEGDRFGYLVVIRDSGRRNRRHRVFECLCDCGNTHYVKSICLTQGQTKSCGCLRRAKGGTHTINVPIIRKSTLNSIGLTINRLTVIDFKKEIKKPLRVILKCSCGNVVEKDYKEFKKGNIKSCGCLKREISKNAIINKEKRDIAKRLPKPIPQYILKRDLSKSKQGLLTILHWCGIRIAKKGRKIPLWYCRCECGKYVIKTSDALKNAQLSCGCTLYEWRKNNAIKTSKGNKKKILSYLKEEWHPRDEIDHKNRRFKATIKTLLKTKYPNGCVICAYGGDKINQLCGHHYKPHALFPHLRYVLSNLTILCRNCHDELHKTLGYNCTSVIEQITYINSHKQGMKLK